MKENIELEQEIGKQYPDYDVEAAIARLGV